MHFISGHVHVSHHLTLYCISSIAVLTMRYIKTQNIGLFSLVALLWPDDLQQLAWHFYFLKVQKNEIVKLQTCRIVKLQYNCIKTQNNGLFSLMALLWMTCSKLVGTFQPASSSTSCCGAKITRTNFRFSFGRFVPLFCQL